MQLIQRVLQGSCGFLSIPRGLTDLVNQKSPKRDKGHYVLESISCNFFKFFNTSFLNLFMKMLSHQEKKKRKKRSKYFWFSKSLRKNFLFISMDYVKPFLRSTARPPIQKMPKVPSRRKRVSEFFKHLMQNDPIDGHQPRCVPLLVTPPVPPKSVYPLFNVRALLAALVKI